VTRFGVLDSDEITPDDQITLERLGLRPRFVAVERDLIEATIEGDLGRIREVGKRERFDEPTVFTDGGGALVLDVGRRSSIE
jgi:hypothetical protein